MSRLKLIPWVLGVVLLTGSLVGANRLLNPDAPPPAGGNAAKPPAAKDGGAVVVTGTVAPEPDLVAYAGSPLLPSARVAEVYVKEGEEVAVGKPLYKFDDTAALADVAKAKAAVDLAKQKKNLAERKQKVEQPNLIKKAELAVAAAKKQRDTAKQAHDAARDEVEKQLRAWRDPTTTKPYTQEEITQKLQTNEHVLRTQALLDQAEAGVKEKEYDLEQAQNALYAEHIQEAAAAVALAEAELAKAELVARECVVKAREAGVIERLEATAGVVVGPTTRTPLLWLVPNGPRVVRAEVVPEFAFKIQNRIGQAVTILDDNNTALTYDGEVKRVSGAFLQKRSAGADFLGGKPQLVLEVIVAVKDPAPPGKPPLRVGQPVRVSIGQ